MTIEDIEKQQEQIEQAGQALNKGFIYLLQHKNNIYIGSTNNMTNRYYKHKYDSKKKENKLYSYIKDIGGIDNFKILNIDTINYNNTNELKQLEQNYINLFRINSFFNILNTNESFLNINANNVKEYNKLYNLSPKRKQYLKEYYLKNKTIKT